MSQKERLFRQYFVFVLGLFVISMGVAMSTKAGLGSSPVSSLPYSMSLILPVLTIGNWTILLNLGLMAGQYVLLNGKMKLSDAIIQLLATFVFGYFVDFSMFLLQWLPSKL